MLDLQHQYNNCTTIPHMRVGPTYWGPPHVRGCCTVVVLVLYKNQIPEWNPCVGPTSLYLSVVSLLCSVSVLIIYYIYIYIYMFKKEREFLLAMSAA
jgi:hypothetical protein